LHKHLTWCSAYPRLHLRNQANPACHTCQLSSSKGKGNFPYLCNKQQATSGTKFSQREGQDTTFLLCVHISQSGSKNDVLRVQSQQEDYFASKMISMPLRARSICSSSCSKGNTKERWSTRNSLWTPENFCQYWGLNLGSHPSLSPVVFK
jgi:hypothetical protein